MIFDKYDDIDAMLPSFVRSYPLLFDVTTLIRTRQDFNSLVCSGINPFDISPLKELKSLREVNNRMENPMNKKISETSNMTHRKPAHQNFKDSYIYPPERFNESEIEGTESSINSSQMVARNMYRKDQNNMQNPSLNPQLQFPPAISDNIFIIDNGEGQIRNTSTHTAKEVNSNDQNERVDQDTVIGNNWDGCGTIIKEEPGAEDSINSDHSYVQNPNIQKYENSQIIESVKEEIDIDSEIDSRQNKNLQQNSASHVCNTGIEFQKTSHTVQSVNANPRNTEQPNLIINEMNEMPLTALHAMNEIIVQNTRNETWNTQQKCVSTNSVELNKSPSNPTIKTLPKMKGSFQKVRLWNEDLEKRINEESENLFDYLQCLAKCRKSFICIHCNDLYTTVKQLHSHLRAMYHIGDFCPIGECTYIMLEEVEYLKHVGIHYKTAIFPELPEMDSNEGSSSKINKSLTTKSKKTLIQTRQDKCESPKKKVRKIVFGYDKVTGRKDRLLEKKGSININETKSNKSAEDIDLLKKDKPKKKPGLSGSCTQPQSQLERQTQIEFQSKPESVPESHSYSLPHVRPQTQLSSHPVPQSQLQSETPHIITWGSVIRQVQPQPVPQPQPLLQFEPESQSQLPSGSPYTITRRSVIQANENTPKQTSRCISPMSDESTKSGWEVPGCMTYVTDVNDIKSIIGSSHIEPSDISIKPQDEDTNSKVPAPFPSGWRTLTDMNVVKSIMVIGAASGESIVIQGTDQLESQTAKPPAKEGQTSDNLTEDKPESDVKHKIDTTYENLKKSYHTRMMKSGVDSPLKNTEVKNNIDIRTDKASKDIAEDKVLKDISTAHSNSQVTAESENWECLDLRMISKVKESSEYNGATAKSQSLASSMVIINERENGNSHFSKSNEDQKELTIKEREIKNFESERNYTDKTGDKIEAGNNEEIKPDYSHVSSSIICDIVGVNIIDPKIIMETPCVRETVNAKENIESTSSINTELYNILTQTNSSIPNYEKSRMQMTQEKTKTYDSTKGSIHRVDSTEIKSTPIVDTELYNILTTRSSSISNYNETRLQITQEEIKAFDGRKVNIHPTNSTENKSNSSIEAQLYNIVSGTNSSMSSYTESSIQMTQEKTKISDDTNIDVRRADSSENKPNSNTERELYNILAGTNSPMLNIDEASIQMMQGEKKTSDDTDVNINNAENHTKAKPSVTLVDPAINQTTTEASGVETSDKTPEYNLNSTAHKTANTTDMNTLNDRNLNPVENKIETEISSDKAPEGCEMIFARSKIIETGSASSSDEHNVDPAKNETKIQTFNINSPSDLDTNSKVDKTMIETYPVNNSVNLTDHNFNLAMNEQSTETSIVNTNNEHNVHSATDVNVINENDTNSLENKTKTEASHVNALLDNNENSMLTEIEISDTTISGECNLDSEINATAEMCGAKSPGEINVNSAVNEDTDTSNTKIADEHNEDSAMSGKDTEISDVNAASTYDANPVVTEKSMEMSDFNMILKQDVDSIVNEKDVKIFDINTPSEHDQDFIVNEITVETSDINAPSENYGSSAIIEIDLQTSGVKAPNKCDKDSAVNKINMETFDINVTTESDKDSTVNETKNEVSDQPMMQTTAEGQPNLPKQ